MGLGLRVQVPNNMCVCNLGRNYLLFERNLDPEGLGLSFSCCGVLTLWDLLAYLNDSKPLTQTCLNILSTRTKLSKDQNPCKNP